MSFADKLRQLAGSVFKGKEPPPAPLPEPEAEEELCCEGSVHIAYRGASDDKQYIAYSRKWKEVKFFKPNGLKVFCANCRRRLM